LNADDWWSAAAAHLWNAVSSTRQGWDGSGSDVLQHLMSWLPVRCDLLVESKVQSNFPECLIAKIAFIFREHDLGTADARPSVAFIASGMTESGQLEVRAGLVNHLARLWRYGLVLSGRRDVAEDLVQATCVRALERSSQFALGSRLDRWLFSILRSIWLNELRSRRIRQGEGVVDAESALVFEGAREIETNILAHQVLRHVQSLPQAQRETLFLAYVEGLTYRDTAEMLDVPIGTVMSRLAAARETLSRLNPFPENASAAQSRRQ
jgi:RNA polymerase sigma-70 factor, ECF subfamily